MTNLMHRIKNKLYRYAVKKGWLYSISMDSVGYYSEQDERKKEILLSRLHLGL